MKICFLGDISTLTKRPPKVEGDYIIGNLECSLGGEGIFPAPRIKGGRVALQSDPELVKEIGLSAVSLANNHIWDYGQRGFDITKTYLDSWGVKYTGAGSAVSPAIIDNIILLGYSWHVWPMTVSKMLDGVGANDIVRKDIKRDVERASKTGKFVAVYLHWGFEKEPYVMPSQVRLARDIIDWGADCIIGSHSHVLSGIERYKNSIIAYGLGNFVWNVKRGFVEKVPCSIGLCVDEKKNYTIEVYEGNNQNIMRSIQEHSSFYSKDYQKIWEEQRLRKNLPNKIYKDTFDVV